jgi:hypothetical protein
MKNETYIRSLNTAKKHKLQDTDYKHKLQDTDYKHKLQDTDYKHKLQDTDYRVYHNISLPIDICDHLKSTQWG